MGLAEELDIDFLQEVYATRVALREMAPQADVAVEVLKDNGEDARIIGEVVAGEERVTLV